MTKRKFGGESCARSLVGGVGFVLLGTLSVACHIQVTDGGGEGGSNAGFGGASPSGSGGSDADGAVSSGGASTASGGASTAGASNSAGSGSTNVEDCGHPDALGNDDREHAVNFGSGATICVLDSSDHDWFYVDTPDDHRAHVIQLDFTETAGSWVNASVIASADGSSLGDVHPSQRGLKLSAFVTVGPATHTLFDFHGFVANTDTTRIDVSMLTEMDEHEPNNDRESASAIQVGSEVTAQLINPYVSETNQQIQDWYRLDLAAGKHTVKVTAVPSDLYPTFAVVDSAGAVLSSNAHGANRGATFSFTFTAEAAGAYFLRVENFVDQAVLYAGVRAASYTEPYKFQVD